MTANSHPDNALRNLRLLGLEPQSGQPIGSTKVTRDAAGIHSRKRDDLAPTNFAKAKPDNGMQLRSTCAMNSDPGNSKAVNDLREFERPDVNEKSEENSKSLIAPSMLVRWCKFNLVGGIGIGVQFAALFLLKTVLHFNYLAATAIAVEAAVVHNFVWHEQFTWADRIGSDSVEPRWRRSLPRLIRFNLTNGAVSILGNLALMKVMVGQGHMNYLLANAIAIALCSVANFLVSEEWVFAKQS
jgi:putative flippase GtrA